MFLHAAYLHIKWLYSNVTWHQSNSMGFRVILQNPWYYNPPNRYPLPWQRTGTMFTQHNIAMHTYVMCTNFVQSCTYIHVLTVQHVGLKGPLMYTFTSICSITLTSSNYIISVHGILYSCTWFWHIMHGMHVQSCGIVAEVDQSIHLGWNCLRWSMHLVWNCMLELITAMILVYFCRLVKSQEILRKQEQEVSILACSLRNTNKCTVPHSLAS